MLLVQILLKSGAGAVSANFIDKLCWCCLCWFCWCSFFCGAVVVVAAAVGVAVVCSDGATAVGVTVVALMLLVLMVLAMLSQCCCVLVVDNADRRTVGVGAVDDGAVGTHDISIAESVLQPVGS